MQARPVSMGDETSRPFVHAGPARAALPGRGPSAYVDDHVSMLTSLNGARTWRLPGRGQFEAVAEAAAQPVAQGLVLRGS